MCKHLIDTTDQFYRNNIEPIRPEPLLEIRISMHIGTGEKLPHNVEMGRINYLFFIQTRREQITIEGITQPLKENIRGFFIFKKLLKRGAAIRFFKKGLVEYRPVLKIRNKNRSPKKGMGYR